MRLAQRDPDVIKVRKPAIRRRLVAKPPPDPLLRVQRGLVPREVVEPEARVALKERRHIVPFVPPGTIDVEPDRVPAEPPVEVAERLEEARPIAPRPPAPANRPGGQGWLRVRVTDMATGRTKVNVNLPLGLVDAGMNIATQFAPDINLSQIAEAIKSGDVEGKIVDVYDEEDGEHVEVFID